MQSQRLLLALKLCVLATLLMLTLAWPRPGPARAAAGNSITSPDTAGDVGGYTSLALDASGNPVVSYVDVTNWHLKVLHCDDPICSGDESSNITSPDTGGWVIWYISLALDASGYPVVSYWDQTNGHLKVLHCGDANCTSGNTITSPDIGGTGGGYTSLALDSSGHPVVSYCDGTNGDLKLLHCGDADCISGNSITSPDTGGWVGAYTSLALDSSGYPVVSYYDGSNGDLKVLHCGDANCTLGNSISSPDTGGDVGQYTSLALDSSGNPVVSYLDTTNYDLKVLHCGDANCTSGNTITLPDTGGAVGYYTSLALDASGYPVVSYHDGTNQDLKVLHCGDANCTSGNTITSPDTVGDVGEYTSLALDASGNPVVSYSDYTSYDYDLKVMHCGDAYCSRGGNSITSPDTGGSVGMHTSLALDASGNPVVSYFDVTNWHLKVLHCDDPICSGDESSNITSPDTGGWVGEYTSLALDSSGYPVVSYYDSTNIALKVLHCNDANCAGGDESMTSPDTGGLLPIGLFTSLALDSSGYPVVSYHYWDGPSVGLKVLHCNDPNCSGGDESITSPDTGGAWTSLVLDSSGYPVVSYYDGTNWDLKVLHCNDPNCSGGDESITSPDTAGYVGSYTSLALDASGCPVVSYYDGGNSDLKVLRCNDPNCAGGDESVTSPDTVGEVGEYTSLALDAWGYPLVSYFDFTNFDLKVMHCGNADCTSGNSITSPDTGGNVGTYTSLALDAWGYPVVSYFDDANQDLKVLHCRDSNCGAPVSSEDFDGDGCTDAAEWQSKGTANTGGGRDPKNPWDFFDPTGPEGVPDQYVDLVNDIQGVILKYQQRPEDTTTVSGQHEIGVGSLNVASVAALNPRQSGIYAGDVIVIDLGGANEEFVKVMEPITGSQLTLSLPTTKKHVEGETVRAYIPSYDRGPSAGPNPWNMTAPDGTIDLFNDILGVIYQYGHDCRPPP